MFTIETQTHVNGIHGAAILNFLLHCTDSQYQAWWPGTHLAFHTLTRRPGDVGNRVYMDEFIGQRRVKLHGVLTAVAPGRKIVWQMVQIIRLPVWLTLQTADDGRGVTLTHTVCAGFAGPGRVLDPLFRLYFSDKFRRALDAHVKTEFARLRDLLTRQPKAHRAADRGEYLRSLMKPARTPVPVDR